MPYNTFCFLMDELDIHLDECSADMESADASLQSNIEGIFRGWRDKCLKDSQAWYKHEMLLTRSGRMVWLRDRNDWMFDTEQLTSWENDKSRQRAHVTSKIHPNGDIWMEKICMYALRQAAMGVIPVLIECNQGQGTASDIMENMLKLDSIELINWLYSNIYMSIEISEKTASHYYMMDILSMLESSILPPFSTKVFRGPSKEDIGHRCFDLRVNSREPVNLPTAAILITEIHTEG